MTISIYAAVAAAILVPASPPPVVWEATALIPLGVVESKAPGVAVALEAT